MLRNHNLALRNEQTKLGSAQRLFANTRSRGRRNQFWSLLTGQSARLLDLRAIRKNLRVGNRCDGGLMMVSIDQICGSESRVYDFDADFNPLQDNTMERWLSIATALKRGIDLPPVILIQVGEQYFVRDGHHRISVARAQGQKVIRAKVEVWQLQIHNSSGSFRSSKCVDKPKGKE